MNRVVNISIFLPIFLFALLFAEATTAQRLQDWVKLGDVSMQKNDPYGALRYYTRAMEIDSTKGEVIYKYAEALRANHNYEKAAFYYLQIYRRERGVIYPHSGFWLATMQMQAGNYEEAKQNWRRVRNQFKNNPNSYEYKKAVQSIRSCDLAMEWSNEQTQKSLEDFPPPITSNASEMAGQFTNDKELIFTSLRGETNKKGEVLDAEYAPQLYIADSSFRNVERFEISHASLNPYHYSASANGQWTATVAKNENGKSEIKVFENNLDILTIPQQNDTSWYSHPAFGQINDRDVLFFASNRSGGFGKEDIWYVFLDEPAKDPINAGPNINSPGSEITPFYRNNTQKLYFSSDWHHGFGGYDIFESEVINGDFQYPQNLKKPFNSPANDLYYSFNEKLKMGTITSNRTGSMAAQGEGCCNDLWMFLETPEQTIDSLPEITTLEELNDYLPVTLFFHNDEPDPRTRNEETNKNYLETYHEYIKLIPQYQLEYRKGLSENLGDKAEDAMDKFFIDEVDQGVEDLELFTKLLLAELEKGAKISLTVKGFASPLAATDYNVKLTSRRISSLENYLKTYKQGVFLPYLNETATNNGTLRLNKIPFGEYVASAMLSDNPNESDAIYSIGAARERKIEITSVQRILADADLAEVIFDSQIKDFGSIQSTDILAFAFHFTYAGDLKIDTLEADRSQISLNTITFENGKGSINGVLHPRHTSGKENLTIILTGNFAEEKIELNLSFEVEE